MGPPNVRTPRPGGVRGVERSTEAGNLDTHSGTHGPTGIAQYRADLIRLQTIGQIGGA